MIYPVIKRLREKHLKKMLWDQSPSYPVSHNALHHKVPSAPHSRMEIGHVSQVFSSLQNLASSVPSASLQLARFIYPCTHLVHTHTIMTAACRLILLLTLTFVALLHTLHLMWSFATPNLTNLSLFHEIWVASLCLTSLLFLSPSCFSDSITLTAVSSPDILIFA